MSDTHKSYVTTQHLRAIKRKTMRNTPRCRMCGRPAINICAICYILYEGV